MKASMEEKLHTEAERSHSRTIRRRIISLLSVVVLALTTVSMVLPANTATAALICGKEEHTHTAECYDAEGNLICGKEEHVHTAACYEQAGKLSASASDGMRTEVSYDAGVLHNGTTMHTALLGGAEADTAKSQVQNALATSDPDKEITAIYAYDIGFTNKDGNKTEPDGNVDVTLSFPQPKSAPGDDTVWKVFHIEDSGAAVDLGSAGQKADLHMQQSGGAVTGITFQASAFSPYVLVALGSKTEETESDTSSDSTAVSKSGDNGTTVMADSATQKDNAGASSADSSANTTDTDSSTVTDSSANSDSAAISTSGAQRRATFRPRMLAAGTNEGNDLSKFITSVESYKYENGSWVATTNFTNGDTAQFVIKYSLPSHSVSDSNATFSYSLGDDGVIVPSSGLSGDVTDGSGNDVGDYAISTDGTIKIKFNDKLDTTVAFTGQLAFEGTVQNNNDSEPKTHTFSNGTTITVQPSDKPKTTDLSISKSGALQSDGLVHYTVTVSTTKGTSDAVTVKDTMQGIDMSGSLTYSNISIKDGNGSTVTPTSGSTFPFTLPKMSANSQYVITYTVKPGTANSTDGSSKIYNKSEAGSGVDHGSSEIWTDVTHKMLEKYWGYGDSGKYRWTITINPDHQDITGSTLQDTFTAQTGGDPISLPSTVTVTNQNGKSQEVSFTEGKITFPISGFSATDKYTITYQTDIPTGTEGSTYTSSNKAEFTDNSKTYTVTSDASYTIPVKEYGVQKWSITDDSGNKTGEGSVEEKDGYNLLTWVARIDLPSQVTSSSDMTFEDELKNEDGQEDASSHYTTAALLNDTNYTHLWSENGNKLELGKDYHIYAGSKDITGSSSEDAITNFKIVFTDDYVANRLNGQTTISLNYQSKAVTQGLHVGNSRKFTNTATVQGKTSDGEYVDKVTGNLDKQSSASKDGPYSSGDVKVDLDSGKIYYRLLAHINSKNDSAITIKDTLPDGLTVDPNSISAVYTSDLYNNNSEDDNRNYKHNIYYVSNDSPYGDLTDQNVFRSSVSDDGKTLTLNLPAKTYAKVYDYLVVYYSANIDTSEKSVWNDSKIKKEVYSNKATWEEKDASDTEDTEVDRKVKTLEKTVTQLKDDKGKLTNNLEYQIVVNPGAEDLLEGSDTIHLTDKVSGITDNAYIRLVPEKTVIYQYSETAEKNRGSVMNTDRYSFTYDENSNQLEFDLPDETAMVICYTYHVTPGVNLPTITNEALLDGVSGSGSKVSQKLAASASSSIATQSVIYLYKVDEDDYGIRLPGVEFKLQVYDPDTVQWNSQADDGWSDVSAVTTGNDGSIRFVEGDKGNPEKGKLYRLVETNNPNSGYGSSANYTTYYFAWMNRSGENSDKGTIWNNFSNKLGITNKELSQDSVHWLYDGSTIYITNPYQDVQVRKVWLDQDNQEITNPGKTVTVHLHQKIGGYVHNHVAVSLVDNSGNSKTYAADVEPGTPVTITILGSMSSVTYNGKTYSGTWDASEGATKCTVNFGTITSDENFEVNVGYVPNVKSVNLDYTKPTKLNFTGDTIIDTQVLSSSNQWKYTWDGTTRDATGNTVSLPKTDGNGNTYVYSITEDPVSGYTASYSDGSAGIKSGKITVTNKKNASSGYELPKTGGGGTFPFIYSGIVLMAVSAVAAIWNKRRKRGG
ncbi:MAG: Cna B-type domain-containing protein [Bilifractor sp.]